MNETLKTPNSQENLSDFECLASEREPWSQHIVRAKEFLRKKFSGEKSNDGAYKLIDNAKYKNAKSLKDVIKSWDDNNDVIIPAEVGKELEKYVDNDEYWVGVHHCEEIEGANFEDDDILKDMMINGIKNFGALQQGAAVKNPSLTKTLASCNNMLNTVISIKRRYGQSTGAVIVAIPHKYVDEDGCFLPGMEDEVYNRDKHDNAVIKPEFNVGFITAHIPGENICQYRSRDELLKHYLEK